MQRSKYSPLTSVCVFAAFSGTILSGTVACSGEKDAAQSAEPEANTAQLQGGAPAIGAGGVVNPATGSGEVGAAGSAAVGATSVTPAGGQALAAGDVGAGVPQGDATQVPAMPGAAMPAVAGDVVGDVGAGDVGAGDVGAGDVGVGDVGAGDVGAGDVGTPTSATDDVVVGAMPADTTGDTESSESGTEASGTDPVGVDAQPVDGEEQEVPSLIGDITFSTPSGTFEGSVEVALTGPAGAEVRYAVDGQLPTGDSPVYDGQPLTFRETTQLRTQVFVDGMPSGEPSTAIYIRRTFDVPSDVPIVIMEGYDGGRPQKATSFGGGRDDGDDVEEQPWYDTGFMLFEPVDGQASISDTPTLVTRAGYRERGQSSAGAEKSPYRVEFRDNYDEDMDLPVLGMPAEADWAMIGEYFDKSQIQNSLVYGWGREMGLHTVRLRFAELYINFDGGPLEESDFFGLYAITETIKNQKQRIDLKQLTVEDTELPEISGGYIFKFDQSALDGGEPELICTGDDPVARGGGGGTCWNDLGIVDPEPANEQQVAWLNDYVQQFHDALHSDGAVDYKEFIDVKSFIDHMIINEITRDVDAYVRSSYFNKDRDGLMKAGPLWDYNLALASYSGDVEGWHFESQLSGRGNDDWFYMMGQDEEFMAFFGQRWRELRETFLSDTAVQDAISAIIAPITNAGQRDTERWPGSSFGGGGGGTMRWLDYIEDLRTVIPERMAWIDTAVN